MKQAWGVTKNQDIHVTRGYAIVTSKGKILVDTVHAGRLQAEQLLSMWDEQKGNKVMRVEIVVNMKQAKK